MLNAMTPVYNDNQGAVDWTKGCSVSKKLRHVNLRELLVRLHQKLSNVDVKHIAGKQNIADILTKEEKDSMHYHLMAFTITTPHLLESWDPETGDTVLPDGSIERPQTKYQKEAIKHRLTTTTGPLTELTNTLAGAARGVLARSCTVFTYQSLVIDKYTITGRLTYIYLQDCIYGI